jgi:hypothetical protein
MGYTNQEMNDYMKRRWRLRREVAVKFLGGACTLCGSVSDLHFHHSDPLTKVNTIAKMSSSSEEKFWAEVRKCVLLCGDCHRKHHSGH